MKSSSYQASELIPVEDHKIYNLLQPKNRQFRLESSGVCRKDGYFYVIFDNLYKVARIDEKLSHERPKNRLLPDKDHHSHDKRYEGYEDITYNQRTGEFYLLVEVEKHENEWESKIIQCDSNLMRLKNHPEWVDPRIEVEGEKHNKGLEGLTWINRNETDFLLVLHEKTGHIYTCRQDGNLWKAVDGPLHLPNSVRFDDYSSLDIKDNQVAVVSQESAKLWVGRLHDSKWAFVNEGRIYNFPDYYCNIEGVAWITPSRIVAVSDKAKDDQPDNCQCLDQSIHIFDLPDV